MSDGSKIRKGECDDSEAGSENAFGSVAYRCAVGWEALTAGVAICKTCHASSREWKRRRRNSSRNASRYQHYRYGRMKRPRNRNGSGKRPNVERFLLAAIALVLSCTSALAQNGRYDSVAFSSSGRFAPEVNVAVCTTLTSTAASVSGNVATLTFASNPTTQGFVAGFTLTVSGFTGADTYFNGSFLISATSSTTISFPLTHANASAGTNGSVYMTGNSTQACAALATIATDSTGATSSPNPFTADDLGKYGFWAAPGQYKVQLYGPTVTTSISNVSIACVPSNTVNCGALLGSPNTWTATQTFTGAITCTIVNLVRCISPSNPQGWAGTDVGGWINSAYANCPTNGTEGSCEIQIAMMSDGTCYAYSTPIVLATSNKSVLLQGTGTASAVGGVCLNYTPTTATKAVTMDYTPLTGPGFARAGGIRDITLQNNNCVTVAGCGSSATGITFGGTNGGAAFADFEHFRIQGFGTAAKWLTSLSFGQTWQDFSIDDNTTGLSNGFTEENISFESGFIASNGTGLLLTGGGDWKFTNVSFDDNQTIGAKVGTAGAQFICTDCHFENAQGGTTHYIQSTGFSAVILIGGVAVDDMASGTIDWWFKSSAYNFSVSHMFIQSAGRSVTEVLEADSPVRANVLFLNNSPTSGTGTIYGGTSTFVTNLSYNYGASATAAPWTLEAALSSKGSVRASQAIADQGAGCTNGELALSTGWQSTGSATVTAAAGTGQTCSWTITTGTTTAANPTVTDTLTNPLPTATTVCELNVHGGTHTAAAGEGFTQTSLSATAPIFTFIGTPTPGGTTYFVTRRCGP
jgi:hypothetical protein